MGSPAEEGNFRQADLIHALVEAASMADTSDSGVGEPAAPALTDRELYGNIFIFLFAGHETTAHTLIYALTLLALHPKEQDKLFDEVIAAIGTTSTPAYEDFGELAYALCVFNETLRLFPPVVAIPKKFTEDTMIDEKYTVEKDVYITLHVAALHRNPKYWGDDANEFRPSRFDTRKNADAYNRDAFIPFR